MEPLNHLLSQRSEEFLGPNHIVMQEHAEEMKAATQPPIVRSPEQSQKDRDEVLRVYISQVEAILGKIKSLLDPTEIHAHAEATHATKPAPIFVVEEEQQNADEIAHEGVFNGEHMISSDGNTYPVPANYASKSKLVEGDLLKVIISPDGRLMFKQIGPIERERKIGDIVLEEDGMYRVHVDARPYRVLAAAVTYHKGRHGEKAVILVPKDTPSTWAAVEYIIHN